MWSSYKHEMINIKDCRLHVTRAGAGPTVLLVAGYPQSSYAWRKVMPILSQSYNVIAIDLPGQGYSDRPTDGFDTETTAHRIYQLVNEMNIGQHYYVGHDIGAWVGYPYAHLNKGDLSGVVFLDANIPGVTLKTELKIAEPDYWRNWHFLFNMITDLPEALLAEREGILINWFFKMKTKSYKSTFTDEDLKEYEKQYSQPGVLTGMLGYYRSVLIDMEQNQKLFEKKINVPVLALGGDSGSAPDIAEALSPLCENLEGGRIADCGHYIPEEQPEILCERMIDFFQKNPLP